MSIGDLVARFGLMSSEQQISFLSRLAADITLWARDTYEAGTDNVLDPQRLRSFNEFQHRVASQLLHMLERDAKRYPPDVFATMLVDYAAELHCERSLLKAFELSEKPKSMRASA